MANDRDDERRRQSDEALARVARESTTIGDSALGGVAADVKRHFAAADVGPADPIEVWGTRIGRGLALVAVALLIWHLLATYG